jgi:poly(3-hydroxybutyrate) depolymerase
MPALILHLIALIALAGQPLGPGDHDRAVTLGESTRSYLGQFPPRCDPKKPMPVALVLHGVGMNGRMMAWFCSYSKKADGAGFIAVY